MYIAQTTKNRIKELCKDKNINAKQMLIDCSLGANAIQQINDIKGMASFSLAKIADYLDVSTDYLLGRTDNPEINKAPVITQEPTNIIKIPLAVSKVSAGYGAYISDDYPDEIEIDANTYPKADFAVQITGDSMQPDYRDGKKVLVHKQPYLENGQIGIFMYNGEGFIKQYHEENDIITLVSLNPEYKPIKPKPTDDFQIVGHVLYTI
jgi:SOS-response transcriptional repressor LexA